MIAKGGGQSGRMARGGRTCTPRSEAGSACGRQQYTGHGARTRGVHRAHTLCAPHATPVSVLLSGRGTVYSGWPPRATRQSGAPSTVHRTTGPTGVAMTRSLATQPVRSRWHLPMGCGSAGRLDVLCALQVCLVPHSAGAAPAYRAEGHCTPPPQGVGGGHQRLKGPGSVPHGHCALRHPNYPKGQPRVK